MTDTKPGSEGSAAPKPPRPFLLRDPEEAPRRARFRRRLLAVLAAGVLVIAGTVAGQAAADRWRMRRSYEEWMTRDLERLQNVQERYREVAGSFGTVADIGPAFVPSQGVHVTIRDVSSSGWTATATHVRSRTACHLDVQLPGSEARPASITCSSG